VKHLQDDSAQLVREKCIDDLRALQHKRYTLALPPGVGVCDVAVKHLRLAAGAFREARAAAQQFKLRGAPLRDTVYDALQAAVAEPTNPGTNDAIRAVVQEALSKNTQWEAFHRRIKDMVRNSKIAEGWGCGRLPQAVDARLAHCTRTVPVAPPDRECTFLMTIS
jgi:hypothetical protein